MNAHIAKSERTRRDLIAAARAAFAEHGYEAVSLRDITESLGLTKGAMYHHFASKDELFEHAVAQSESEIYEQLLLALAGETSTTERIIIACREYVRGATTPDRARLLLDDGPTVLGWSRWIDFTEAPGERGRMGAEFVDHLRRSIDVDACGPLGADALGQFISGGLMSSARWIALDREARLETGLELLERVLRRLLPDRG